MSSRRVSFSETCDLLEFAYCLGDHPTLTGGPPLSSQAQPQHRERVPLRDGRRHKQAVPKAGEVSLRLVVEERIRRLRRSGAHFVDIGLAEKESTILRLKRAATIRALQLEAKQQQQQNEALPHDSTEPATGEEASSENDTCDDSTVESDGKVDKKNTLFAKLKPATTSTSSTKVLKSPTRPPILYKISRRRREVKHARPTSTKQRPQRCRRRSRRLQEQQQQQNNKTPERPAILLKGRSSSADAKFAANDEVHPVPPRLPRRLLSPQKE